jgi:hypothetical protein
MRTTLSLDDDVAAQLDQLRSRRSASYKDVVNEVLRAGLAHLDRETPPRPGPFTRPAALGRPRLPEVDDISDALALAEGEDHR